jgi:DNA-binding winged helix-turn-helix (wHTH) protein
MSVHFGDFTLDESRRQLLSASEPVHLSPKAFQLLSILIQQRPRAVSKTDLQEQLWPDTFVTEGNLAGLVAELRSALGDDAHEPRFIRTLYGFGYSFAAAAAQQGIEVSSEPRISVSRPSFQVVAGGCRYPLIDGENILGRADDCEVSLKLASISRRHAVITVDTTGITLRDLRSKNGTFVHGWRIDSAVDLRDGDQIRLGSVALNVTLTSADGSTVTDLQRDDDPNPKT